MNASVAMPSGVRRLGLEDEVIWICEDLGCAGPILLVMDFAGRLDERLLERAARLLPEAEPTLACRVEATPDGPVWRPLGDLDAVSWFTLHETDDSETAIRAILTPRPEHHGSTFHLHLARHPGGDSLLLWLTHVIGDGFWTYECAYRLAELYSGLAEDPDYRPEPNRAPPVGLEWMDRLTWRDTWRITRRDVSTALRSRGPVLGFRRDYDAYRAAGTPDAAHVVHRLSPDTVAAIDRATARGASRNDVLLAAFARAFPDFVGRPADGTAGPRVKIALTIDLRRFAEGRTLRAPGNMVGIAYVTVGPELGPRFDDTLAQVAAETGRQKRDLMGVGNPLFVKLLGALSYRWRRRLVESILRRSMARPLFPTLSNAGTVDAGRLPFAGTAPDHVEVAFYPPALPLFLVSVLRYRDTIALTACFQPADLEPQRVRDLLERIEREIRDGS